MPVIYYARRAPDNLSGSLTVTNNSLGGFLRFGHSWRLGGEPPQTGMGVRYHGRQRLVHFVCDGCGKFASRCGLYRARQPRLAAAQGFFRILPVIDIDQQAVPASHSTFTIERGLAERLKPSVDAIPPAEPALNFERLAGCNGPRPCVRSRLHIIRMEEVLPDELRPGVGARPGVIQ